MKVASFLQKGLLFFSTLTILLSGLEILSRSSLLYRRHLFVRFQGFLLLLVLGLEP
mgnify:CR=1 FL=1